MEALPPPGYVGKRHIQLALDSFHAANSAVGVALNVTRRPFSFAGRWVCFHCQGVGITLRFASHLRGMYCTVLRVYERRLEMHT